jgi:hypothetical protein
MIPAALNSRKRPSDNPSLVPPRKNLPHQHLPELQFKKAEALFQASAPETLPAGQYLLVPYPQSKEEDIIALGVFLNARKNNPALKEALKNLEDEQQKDESIRLKIRKGDIKGPLHDFYSQILREISQDFGLRPCVAYYACQLNKQCVRKEVKTTESQEWIWVRKSITGKDQFAYDLLIPSSFYR